MGSRSLGELLLRPNSLARLPFFQTCSTVRVTAPSWSSKRTLTNSTPSHSAQPQPREEPVDEPPPRAPPNQASTQFDFLGSTDTFNRPPTPSSSEQVTQGIDNLFSGMNSPSFRRAVPSATRSTTSSDELRAAHTQHVFGSNFSPSGGGMQRRRPRDLDKMEMPDDGLPGIFNQPDVPVPEIPESEKNYPRLNPSYGRVVELDPTRGRDLVRGINMLGSLMARNKVRADFMKQRYHERPGLKRKRLKTERWRARFKVGFRDVTARVTELTRKGW